MRTDEKGNMPFAVIAVTILMLASVAGAIASQQTRSADMMGNTEQSIISIDESLEDIRSYINQELGIIILDISKDGSLGTLDERAEVFAERAHGWIDERFPMMSNGTRAELVDRQLEMMAESMSSDILDGYVPAYLHGSGTVTVGVSSVIGFTEKTIEISTDGSYALPLAAEQGSLFERMASDGGISIAQMMSYELTSLAQYRVLDGYGSVSQYGSKGTDSIITRQDVKDAYDNAMSLCSTICFRRTADGEIHDRVDAADLLAGDTVTIDVASFYSQVLVSLVDDIVLKWFDYLCGRELLVRADDVIGRFNDALDSLVSFVTGRNVTSAEGYIVEVMEKNGKGASEYRFPGSGKTTVSAGGYTVTVDNPTVDLFTRDWIVNFKSIYNGSENYIEDFLTQILNSAAQHIYSDDSLAMMVVHIDPYDGTSFIETVSDAFIRLIEGCEDTVEDAIAGAVDDAVFVDPFYAAIAETIQSHASEIPDTDSLRRSIRNAFAHAVSNDENADLDTIMGSPSVLDAIHRYRSLVYRDIEVYDELKHVPGGQPGMVLDILSEITGYGLKAIGITSDVTERTKVLLDEITASSEINPLTGITDLPGTAAFALTDECGNTTAETLTMTMLNNPLIDEPVILASECSHVTGFREDRSAAYTTVLMVHVSDMVTYTVEGSNSFSSAMGLPATSVYTGTFSNDIELRIAVASGWPLMGVAYEPTCDIIDDATLLLIAELAVLMEPLRDLLEILEQIMDGINESLYEITRFATDALLKLYEAILEPLESLIDWFEKKLDDILGDAVLSAYFSLDLTKQSVSFDYLGFTFKLTFNLLSLASSTKTLFTAELEGPVCGLDLDVALTAKIKGDVKKENVFVTGSAKIKGDGWKVNVGVDPLMKGSKHLLTVSGEVGETDVSLIMPKLVDYSESGFKLSDIPGIGDAIGNIPVPGLGVNVGFDAGVSLKYSSPVIAGLIINEYETNPKGNDKGGEWVEILNNTDKAIDLTGYVLSASSDSRSKKMTLSGTISPGEFLIVEPSFTLVNSSGKMTKNGEGLILRDPDGVQVDKTGTHADTADDGFTWQRKYDGSNEWEFREGTIGRSNGSYVMTGILSPTDAKEIIIDSVKDAFEEVGSITDVASAQEIIRLAIQKSLDGMIEKVSGALVEASVFIRADVSDMTSSLTGGITVALRTDSELLEDVLKYIVGKIEELALSMKNPYRIDSVSMFTDNIDLEITFDARIGFPEFLTKRIDELPLMDLGLTFRTNISALTKIFGTDTGTPSVECGVRIMDCPSVVIPSKLSPKNGMVHDLWLFKLTVEWP